MSPENGNGENNAEREARRFAHLHIQHEEGQLIGGDATQPLLDALIDALNALPMDSMRECPHLSKDPDQAKFWAEAIPELVGCALCTDKIAAEEKHRANTRCLICRQHAALRGVIVAKDGWVLRGGVCKDCAGDVGANF